MYLIILVCDSVCLLILVLQLFNVPSLHTALPSMPTLVLAMFNRHIRTEDEIITHLKFCYLNDNPPSSLPRNQEQLIQELFHASVLRYLAGTGHPEGRLANDMHASCGLSPDDLAKSRGDRMLRSQLLLIAASSSKLRPVEQPWSITVCYLIHCSSHRFIDLLS